MASNAVAGLFGDGKKGGWRHGQTRLRAEDGLEEVIGLAIRLQQGFDLAGQDSIARAGVIEMGRPFGGAGSSRVALKIRTSFGLVHGLVRVDGSLLLQAPVLPENGQGKDRRRQRIDSREAPLSLSQKFFREWRRS